MPAIALYYPWMHFQDDDWVKLALLSWDRIARVRPRELPGRDSDLVREVCAESDLIMEVQPSPADLAAVTEVFVAALRDHRKRIVRRFGPLRESADDYAMAMSNAGGSYAPTGTSAPRSFWVYGGADAKISDALRDLLVGADLATPDPDGSPWLGMVPELGSIYLAVLADAMAANNALTPATDDPRMHNALGAMNHLTELLIGSSPVFRDLATTTNAYLHVALSAVLEPTSLATVPVADILKFRARYAAELAAFRAHLDELSGELSRIAEVETLEVARAHLEALYEQRTRPQLDELRRALRGVGVESTVGPLALKIDINAAAGTVLGGVAAAGGQLALAGTAAAMAVLPYLTTRLTRRREALRSSPVAYLLAADRKLAGSRLLRAIR